MTACDAPKAYRAWWLLAICALGFVLVGVLVWMKINTAADPGFNYPTPVKPYVVRLSINPGSDATRAGLRTGDFVDLRQLRPAARYRFLSWNGRFVIGEQLTIPVMRDGRALRFILTPTTHSPIPRAWDAWLAIAGNLWVLIFAAVIAWRRPQNAEARLLSLFLSTSIIGITLSSNNWQTYWPAIDVWVNAIGSPFIANVGPIAIFFFASYAMLFARPPGRLRRLLAWLAYVSCGLATLYLMAGYFVNWTAAVDPNSRFGDVGELIFIAPTVAVFACAIAALVAARGGERTRMSWAMASVGLWNLVYVFRYVAIIVSPAIVTNVIVMRIAPDVANFILPLGLTYSVLNRRLLDIGFALNRATIFTIVSVIIVGTFMLAEWLMGSWLATQSHTTNLVVNAALVVALGFSSRAVHHRVDRFVDAVFFRRRHEDEQAIREFAHEALDATDRASLLEDAREILQKRTDAAFVSFEINDGRGRYGSVEGDDQAIQALLTRRKPLDLHGMHTALHGEFAYPMAVGRRLVGVLVIGPKRSGEPYAPDESAAIAELAHGVGTALALQALTAEDKLLSTPMATPAYRVN